MVGTMRIPPVKIPPRGSTLVPNMGSIGFTPKSRKAAKEHPSWPMWKKAEDDECAGIRQQGVYQRVHVSQVPAGAQILRTQYIYTDKETGPKARLCVHGNDQDPQPSPTETYASTPGAAQVRVVFAHAAQHGRHLWKLDVSQAFTQADKFPQHVHIYIHPPPGQEEFGYVWRLLRPLYGLAIALACWSNTLRTYLTLQGWVPVVHGDETMYKYTVPPEKNNNNNNLSSDNDLILIFHVEIFYCQCIRHAQQQQTILKPHLCKDFARATKVLSLAMLALMLHEYKTIFI